MNSIILFSVLTLVFIAGTNLRVFLKVGWSIKAYKEYWLVSEGRSGIFKSHLKLFSIIVLLPTIMMFLNGAFASGWLKGGSFTAGIQTSGEQSVFCKTKGIGGNSNSNFTLEQNVYTWDTEFEVSAGIYATHHSCDISPDSNGYDKIGPMFKITW